MVIRLNCQCNPLRVTRIKSRRTDGGYFSFLTIKQRNYPVCFKFKTFRSACKDKINYSNSFIFA